MSKSGALLAVVLPAVFAVVGLWAGGRSRVWARDFAVIGTLGCFVAAVIETYGVFTQGAQDRIGFLGRVDTGVVVLHLDLRADELSALVALAVGLVAACVQIYSTAYLHGEGTPDAPIRYPAYAATVSMFTASMMLVVHADDLVLLLVGWEGMGICSYLLIGHHSERQSARAAALKAFLVTRVGDLGVMLAVIVLIAGAGTTSIHTLLAQADSLSAVTVTAAALLMLAGVAGKSAQFPLHTWLPDAMEGPTPVSALIHAATMVAAGVYLVARLLPLFLAAHGALVVAAVMASITMFGAALAALAQDDLKRLLAWSTVSQVAYMLAGVSVAQAAGAAAPGVFHLLSHAAFKALLFLVAGCVTHIVGSTLMSDMGGLRRSHPSLALLLGLGLAALAGVPPLGGFWSKEAVLTAAEHAVANGEGWPAQLVLVSGLLTTLVTGIYAGRAFALVAMGDPVPAAFHAGAAAADPELAAQAREGEPPVAPELHPHAVPRAMTGVLWVLAIPTVLLGLVLVRPPELLAEVRIDPFTGFIGSLLALVGIGWALTAPRVGARDVADAVPVRLRAFVRSGYRLDDVQDALVTRPVQALARVVAGGDRDVVDAYARATAKGTRAAGFVLRLAQSGLATGYVAWLVAGAVLVGLAGVVLS
ncbi:MAG TPA: NADH-quinone oxidoreductase subunit L [Kineosporiaceae bacterium]|nr:NADH-quinone oxidoreductase subunit L [Kineosporiaceae bacterium]